MLQFIVRKARTYVPQLIRSIENLFFRFFFGVNWEWKGRKFNDGNDHMPIPFGIFIFFIAVMRMKGDFRYERIVDVGSGTGKILFLSTLVSKCEVIGIENENLLVQLSRSNLRKLDCQASVIECDALEFRNFIDLGNKSTLIVMFNPLPPDSLKIFIERIKLSAKKGQSICILYFWDVDSAVVLHEHDLRNKWSIKILKTSFWVI